jgi:hypothetical protein
MTGRDAIAGIERSWASPRALLEPCPQCRRVQVLMPVWGHRGGDRLCLNCGADRRRAPRLFEDEPGADR